MNNEQKHKLEKNLTRSAKKASKYWVRGLVGYTESDQGFFPVGDVPLLNPFNEDKDTLDNIHIQTKDEIEKLKELIVELEDKLLEEKASKIELSKKIDEFDSKFEQLETNYEQILEKGLAEYIKMLANL